jgi:type II secretory pathway component PulF
VDASGRKVAGELSSAGRRAALMQLRARGLTPVSVKPTEGQPQRQDRRARPLSRRATEAFCRELGHLLSAGIPMGRALGILRRQGRAATPGVLETIHEDVTGGLPLAEAMGKHPKSFSPVQIAMVQAGEAGGFLDVVLGQIADFQARERDLKGRVRSALAYPAILVTVASGVLIFLLRYFIPRFSRMFRDLGGTLPALTRAIVAVSDAVTQHGLFALLAAALVALLLRQILRTSSGRLARDRAVLRVPVVGALVARLAMVRFCRMLGTLVEAGVPLVSSLRVARQAIGNRVLAETVSGSIEQVVKGGGLARSLASCDRLFPLSVVETLAVAEEAGRLDEELRRLADVHETELDRNLRLAVSLTEPLVLFVMAGLVGMVVIGMLLPIFSLQDLIK